MTETKSCNFIPLSYTIIHLILRDHVVTMCIFLVLLYGVDMDRFVDIDALLGDLELESDVVKQQTSDEKLPTNSWPHLGYEVQATHNCLSSSDQESVSNGFGHQSNGKIFYLEFNVIYLYGSIDILLYAKALEHQELIQIWLICSIYLWSQTSLPLSAPYRLAIQASISKPLALRQSRTQSLLSYRAPCPPMHCLNPLH